MAEARLDHQEAAKGLINMGCFHHACAGASYAVAETWGVEAGATAMGSLTIGSVAMGVASVVAGVAASLVGSASSSVGFSVVFSVVLGAEVLLLTVARSLAKGDNGFSVFSVSSSLVVAFSFLLNHGRELLRLSLLTAVVSVLVSPFVTGASTVSIGTVAGEATLVA